MPIDIEWLKVSVEVVQLADIGASFVVGDELDRRLAERPPPERTILSSTVQMPRVLRARAWAPIAPGTRLFDVAQSQRVLTVLPLSPSEPAASRR